MAISKRLYANNAKTTLTRSISSFEANIEVVDGSRFPIPGPGEHFLITIELGPWLEIIKVNGRNGNILTGCERGQENGVFHAFNVGARVENRVTSKTLDRFEKVADTLKTVTSVDTLDLPINSNSTTYICQSADSSGNPITAIRNTDTNWRFSTHSTISVVGSASTGTVNDLTFTNLDGLLFELKAGKYILQFRTGLNIGLCRLLTGLGTNVLNWGTPLPHPCAPGDQFEVYVSDSSILTDMGDTSNNSLIASLGNRSKHGFLYFMGNL